MTWIYFSIRRERVAHLYIVSTRERDSWMLCHCVRPIFALREHVFAFHYTARCERRLQKYAVREAILRKFHSIEMSTIYSILPFISFSLRLWMDINSFQVENRYFGGSSFVVYVGSVSSSFPSIFWVTMGERGCSMHKRTRWNEVGDTVLKQFNSNLNTLKSLQKISISLCCSVNDVVQHRKYIRLSHSHSVRGHEWNGISFRNSSITCHFAFSVPNVCLEWCARYTMDEDGLT